MRRLLPLFASSLPPPAADDLDGVVPLAGDDITAWRNSRPPRSAMSCCTSVIA
jgi:hypothetical protein